MEKRDSSDRRPSADALLREVQQAEQGRLKIFLGAAPGVGKTYEMLTTAQARRAEGLDVVVGVVETHGRKETEALLEELEVIPRQSISYRGHVLTEMDLDAILARRARLVLVDELAHTNAPESRHPKRYMDVEELLAAGIDVYTTLNIQHVESLNNVVAGITRVRVRETVPDSIIDRANDIEVVDLTPEDLIERLHEGKVYVADQTERAIQHYFSPGNSDALRELALRRTAQRVDKQMVDYTLSHVIEGPWPTGEQVLVLVDAARTSTALVRYAKRMANRLTARWLAIHVETPADARANEAERDHVAQTLRLAQRLGAEVISIPGQDVADTVAEYAQTNNFTHIIVAKSERAHWRDLFRVSVTQKLIRVAGDANVHVIAPPANRIGGAPAATGTTEAGRKPGNLKAYFVSLLYVGAAALIAILLQRTLGVSNAALSFLVAVLASAVSYGLWASLFACLISFLAYNFFFLSPLHTFTISNLENVVHLWRMTTTQRRLPFWCSRRRRSMRAAR